jgi:hypothetical protein
MVFLWGTVHSVGQKSIGLKFSKSRTGSHVMYSCHHNSSRLFSPYLCIHGFSLSSIHGWKRRVRSYQKLKSDLPLTIQSLTLSWVSCKGLQDKYCHKSEVEWGEKDNAGNLTCPPLCQTRGMKVLLLSVTFDRWLSPWHENEISGRGSRVLDFLLKRSVSENSPFKG